MKLTADLRLPNHSGTQFANLYFMDNVTNPETTQSDILKYLITNCEENKLTGKMITEGMQAHSDIAINNFIQDMTDYTGKSGRNSMTVWGFQEYIKKLRKRITIKFKIKPDWFKDRVFMSEDIPVLHAKLQGSSAYLVSVKITKENVEHKAILFTGFSNGAYWSIYNNSYDNGPSKFDDIYSIKIIKLLTKISSY